MISNQFLTHFFHSFGVVPIDGFVDCLHRQSLPGRPVHKINITQGLEDRGRGDAED